MNAADIRGFCARDWRLIGKAKSEYWTAHKRAATPSAALALAAELHEYARTLRPDWPNTAEREEDLALHVRLAGMLQRALPDRAR